MKCFSSIQLCWTFIAISHLQLDRILADAEMSNCIIVIIYWLRSGLLRLHNIFLAAQSGSRSLVVRPLVGWSFGSSETFVKKGPFEYQMVTKSYLPFYLCDSSDRTDQKSFLTKNFFHKKKLNFFLLTNKTFTKKK